MTLSPRSRPSWRTAAAQDLAEARANKYPKPCSFGYKDSLNEACSIWEGPHMRWPDKEPSESATTTPTPPNLSLHAVDDINPALPILRNIA